MKIKCITNYTYRDGEVTFPFSAGTEYAVPDDMAAKVIEAAPDSFEEIKPAAKPAATPTPAVQPRPQSVPDAPTPRNRGR